MKLTTKLNQLIHEYENLSDKDIEYILEDEYVKHDTKVEVLTDFISEINESQNLGIRGPFDFVIDNILSDDDEEDLDDYYSEEDDDYPDDDEE